MTKGAISNSRHSEKSSGFESTFRYSLALASKAGLLYRAKNSIKLGVFQTIHREASRIRQSQHRANSFRSSITARAFAASIRAMASLGREIWLLDRKSVV